MRHRRPRRKKPAPLSLILGEGLGERATADSPHPNPPPTLGEGVCHSPLPDFWKRAANRPHLNPPPTLGEGVCHPPLPDFWKRAANRPHPNPPPTLGEGVCHSPLPDFWERGWGRGLITFTGILDAYGLKTPGEGINPVISDLQYLRHLVASGFRMAFLPAGRTRGYSDDAAWSRLGAGSLWAALVAARSTPCGPRPRP